jgi:hypothetical protein
MTSAAAAAAADVEDHCYVWLQAMQPAAAVPELLLLY